MRGSAIDGRAAEVDSNNLADDSTDFGWLARRTLRFEERAQLLIGLLRRLFGRVMSTWQRRHADDVCATERWSAREPKLSRRCPGAGALSNTQTRCAAPTLIPFMASVAGCRDSDPGVDTLTGICRIKRRGTSPAAVRLTTRATGSMMTMKLMSTLIAMVILTLSVAQCPVPFERAVHRQQLHLRPRARPCASIAPTPSPTSTAKGSAACRRCSSPSRLRPGSTTTCRSRLEAAPDLSSISRTSLA